MQVHNKMSERHRIHPKHPAGNYTKVQLRKCLLLTRGATGKFTSESTRPRFTFNRPPSPPHNAPTKEPSSSPQSSDGTDAPSSQPRSLHSPLDPHTPNGVRPARSSPPASPRGTRHHSPSVSPSIGSPPSSPPHTRAHDSPPGSPQSQTDPHSQVNSQTPFTTGSRTEPTTQQAEPQRKRFSFPSHSPVTSRAHSFQTRNSRREPPPVVSSNDGDEQQVSEENVNLDSRPKFASYAVR